MLAAEEARTDAARAALEGSLAAEAADDDKPARAAAMLKMSETAMRVRARAAALPAAAHADSHANAQASNEAEAALCRAQEAQIASDEATGDVESAAAAAESAVSFAIDMEQAERNA